jgi:hypothetical protein
MISEEIRMDAALRSDRPSLHRSNLAERVQLRIGVVFSVFFNKIDIMIWVVGTRTYSANLEDDSQAGHVLEA